MIGLVGRLAARRPQAALPKRFPGDWLFPMIGSISQPAVRRLQVARPGRLPLDWPFNGHSFAIKVKVEPKGDPEPPSWATGLGLLPWP